MSEGTPDRLQNFRAQYPTPRGGGRGGAVVATLLLVGLAAVIAMQALILRGQHVPAATERVAGLDPETMRAYASYLAEKNLPQEAIAAYESYLAKADLTSEARAKTCLGVAKLAIDQKQYEVALANLYLAEMLAPQSDVKPEIDKRIMQCLDVLGRSSDLKRELKNRTSLQKTAKDVKPGETVLAECAGQVITDRDLDAKIDSFPASMRNAFDDAQKREDLLKNMVVERMLLDKASRQGLDENPEVQDALAKARDELIVRRLIEDEVKSKVTITPEDVERFYKAEPDRFTEPAQAKIHYASADSKDASAAITEPSEKEVAVYEKGDVSGIKDSGELVKATFAANIGERVGPLQIGDRWYVAKVDEKTPSKLHSFEEVRDRAQRMLQSQKEQEQLQSMLDQILQSQDVKMYPERLQEKDEAPAEGSAASASSAPAAKTEARS